MLFPYGLSRRILAMFVNTTYSPPQEKEGDADGDSETEAGVWGDEEPFLWTLARACLVGVIYASCIVCFALCLLLVEKSNEDEAFRARSIVREELQREMQLLLINSSSASFAWGKDNLPDVSDFMDAFTCLCKRSNQYPRASWSYRTGLLLATSVLTTTGYGYIYPTFNFSRLFCAAYSIVGIPLALLFMHKVGYAMLELYWAAPSLNHCKEAKMAAFAVIVVLGVLLLVLVPAIVLAYAERWTYHEATYYAIMTLTTVGLGKHMAGLNPLPNVTESPHLQLTIEVLYHMFLIFWVFIGIAYLTLLANCAPAFEKQLTTKLRLMIKQKVEKCKKLN